MSPERAAGGFSLLAALGLVAVLLLVVAIGVALSAADPESGPSPSRAEHPIATAETLTAEPGPAEPASSEPGPAEPASSELDPAALDPYLRALLDDVNGLRLEAGIVPLEPHPLVLDVAQDVADEITVAGSIHAASPSARAVSDALAQRRYQALRLVLAYAESNAEPDLLLEQWSRSSPEIFEQLESPELRHVGLGLGDSRGVPVHVLVASVSAVRHLGDQARQLDDLESLRERALAWINQQRERAGLRPYYRQAELDRVAQSYAEAMRRRGFYGHVSPEGTTVLDRVRASSYQATRVGENIASGQPTLEMVLDGWMASPDHRSNLLHRDFRQTGLGVAHGPTADGDYQVLWVQVFGSRR